jgi:hypothetical protein
MQTYQSSLLAPARTDPGTETETITAVACGSQASVQSQQTCWKSPLGGNLVESGEKFFFEDF